MSSQPVETAQMESVHADDQQPDETILEEKEIKQRTTTGDDNDNDEEDDEEDDEEEECDDEKQTEEPNPIHAHLQAIVKSIKRFNSKSWEDHQKMFRKQEENWTHLKDQSEKTGDCILHFLIKDEDVSQDQQKELIRAIRHIAKNHTDLLVTKNEDKMTPLYMALNWPDPRRASLVRKGFFASKKLKKVQEKLIATVATKCGPDDENCLHAALKSRLRDPSVLELLVDHATQEAVNARDKHNWTPLHWAVGYQHSSEQTLELLRRLINKSEPDPERQEGFGAPTSMYAFDVYAGAGREKLSVYEYHIKKREEARVQAFRTQSKGDAWKDKGNKKEQEMSKNEQARGPKGDGENQQRMNQPVKPNPSSSRTSGETKEVSREEEKQKQAINRANTSSSRTDSRKTAAGGKGSGTANSNKSTLKVEIKEEVERKEKWSAQIQRELKLHCLRTRTITQATRFLYGSNNNNIELFFDYTGLSENTDAVAFYDNFKAMRFDEVLQYVEFPTVRLKQAEIPRGETFRKHKDLFESKTSGRKDLLFFFDWLKDNNVKHIIDLTVHDSTDCHSDDVIKSCLSGLRIDNLNWSKPDLDPEMLCTACPDVKELHLHWGGNNAILRAWGEPEGLRTLKNLQRIYLYYNQGSEASEKNVDNFRKRIQTPVLSTDESQSKDGHEDHESMAASTELRIRSQDEQSTDRVDAPIQVLNGRDLECTYPQGTGPTIAGLATSDRAPLTVHRWLESLDTFVKELKTLMGNIRKTCHEGDEVKVALIDDGVNICEKEFMEKFINGKSFSYYDYRSSNQREKQWYVSETGHGTVMAHMILRVCPMAKIYPIKLDTVSNSKRGHAEIKTESAIQAIEAAVEKGVQIISMSWTVQAPTGKLKTAFNTALAKAEEKNILMFCSSPDEGVFSGDHYPSAWGADKFFRIGASQADGHPYNWVSDHEVDYLFPGVEVVKNNSKGVVLKGVEDRKTETGSSVSTALAAGLAALVLWFVIIGAKYSGDEKQEDVLNNNDMEKLQNVKDMKQAFKNLNANQGSNAKFIEIWHVLDRSSQSLKDHRGNHYHDVREARRIICNLARDLVKKS